MSLTEHEARMAAQAALIDQAAERAHEAMHDCQLAEGGIERDLWRQVVRAVLETPGLMITAEDIERMVKDAMERTAAALRVHFDQELLFHAGTIEETAKLYPDHPHSPGMIVSAEILRKVIKK
jgi:hypothetical protein